MDSASQELQLRRAGVPLDHIYRDVGISGTNQRRGWHALDRLANASYQIVIEGQSYRERLSPHHALMGKVAKILSKGGD